MKTREQLLRKYVVLLLTLISGTTPLAFYWRTDAAWAQTPKVFKIGILTDAMVPWHTSTNGFRDGLKEFGYVEVKNFILVARAAQ